MEIDLRRVGYLFLLTTEDDVQAFTRNVAMQNRLGVPSRMITPEEAKELSPLINVDDVLAAAYSPDDGHATPEAVVQGYAAGARAHGAQVLTGCGVMAIAVEDGQITAVATEQGEIRTGTVICAAGAWSAAVGQMAGVELPVTPMRRQILYTEPIENLPEHIPMTIDFATGFYFHREGNGLLMGMADPNETPGFKLRQPTTGSPGCSTSPSGGRRPSPRPASGAGWAGLYEVSPDHNALVGEAPAPGRFLYATGFSGHGFLQGPAVGEIVRDLYLGREPFVDVTPLSADRFDGRAVRPERNVV